MSRKSRVSESRRISAVDINHTEFGLLFEPTGHKHYRRKEAVDLVGVGTALNDTKKG